MQNGRSEASAVWREWLLKRTGDERDAKARRERMARGAVLLGIGYILSAAPLLFSVNPLALALLGASEMGVGYALVGVLLGLWQRGGQGAIIYAVAALGVVVLRMAFALCFAPSAKMREALTARVRSAVRRLLLRTSEQPTSPNEAEGYREPLRFRVAATLPMAALVAFSLCVQGDFSYYDLYGAVLMLVGAPLGVCLLCPALGKEARRTSLATLASEALLLLAISYVGRSLTVFGLSPVVALTVVLTLWAARQYGLLYAVLVSVTAGIGYDALCVPMYALMGLLYGLLSSVLGGLSLVAVLLVGMLYALLVGGVSMFWALVPSLCVGVLLYTLPAYRRSRSDELSREQKKHERERAELLGALISEQASASERDRRVARMASAFGSLGEVFSRLGERTADPDAPEARQLCHEVYDAYCHDCTWRGRCWSELVEQTMQEIGELGRCVCEQGKATKDGIPAPLQSRCPHSGEIVEEVNYQLSRRRIDSGRKEGSTAFAHACDTVSCLLRDLLRERDASDASQPHEYTQKVMQYLQDKGMQPSGVCLTGHRRLCVHVSGMTPAALTVESDELRRELGSLLGVQLSRPRFDGSDEGSLTLSALPPLRVDYTHRSLAAKGECGRARARLGVCGDTLRVFENEDGYLFALLCDGMGHGRAAAVTSGCSAVLLERTLQAGVGVHTALRLLNHYLHARLSGGDSADESFSTVDLFVLDLYTGKGQFVKSGAAPTLILRQGHLYRLCSHTVPVGILHAIDAQTVPFEVKEGDHILLMSDGVSDGGNQQEEGDDLRRCGADDWLSAFLSGEGAELPAEDDDALIDQLFSLARAHGSCDDMSVISMRIRSSEKQGSVDKTGKI